MKIELKNFKFYDRLSEETLCFVGNIWINGIKSGTAENTGKGGNTSYYSGGTEDSQKLIARAEDFCDKNDTTLEDYIDELAFELIKKKENELIAKKMNKEMQKSILIGDETQYNIISFKLPLNEMWEKHPDFFKKTLIEKLDKYKHKGYRLLNTNIPQQFLNN
jgi:hypothetical protein